MHPPFFIPDVRVTHDIAHHFDHKPIVRRGRKPARLMMLPAPGWPPINPYLFDRLATEPTKLPSGGQAQARPILHVVPTPRSGIRDTIGRFLIRLGQRMILENRPG